MMPAPRHESSMLSDPMVYGMAVPYAEFARLRRESPVAWVDEVPLWRHSDSSLARNVTGQGYWAITRHATIKAVSRQPDQYSSWSRGAFLADPKSPHDLERTRQLLINMDAPEHARLRQFATASFTPLLIQRLTASIETHARAVVATVIARESFDVVRDVAAELPLLVLADLLGVPREDRQLMFDWSNDIVGFDDPEFGGGSVDRYQRAYMDIFDYGRRLAEVRRRNPGDDLVSQLVTVEYDRGRLTDQEFCNLWMLLVIGGNESTRHLLSGSIQALHQHPAEARRLAAAPDLMWPAVEELLRWVSPVMLFRRTAVGDSVLDGQRVGDGDKIVLYYISANRDEAVFDQPDRLDLGRKQNPHLAFGVGPHFCLGARLARVEAAALLGALLPYLPRLELIGPVHRLRSNFMNGIKSMPARIAAAA